MPWSCGGGASDPVSDPHPDPYWIRNRFKTGLHFSLDPDQDGMNADPEPFAYS
jgi:hypothetical protein